VGLSYLQSLHQDIFLANPITVFFLLVYDIFSFTLAGGWAYQAGWPGVALGPMVNPPLH